MSNQKVLAEQLEIFSAYLKNNGLKMTRQRELIAKNFLQIEGHLTTEEVYGLVKKKDSKIGFATVFRTLKAFADCGLAREINLGDGTARFEPLYKRPQHYHLVCVECSRTIEFFSPELQQLQEKIISEYDFQPVRHRLQIFGVCQDCQNKRVSGFKAFDSDLVFARDALRIAMETERRGVHFYSSASETVSHPSTRSCFLHMLEDEKTHLSRLEKEWERLMHKDKKILDAPVFLHFDFDALKRIFPSRDEVRNKLQGDIQEKDALELAMKMEKEAHDFFRNYAGKFNDTKGRDIFLQFAEEEQEHYDIIKEAYEKLTTDQLTTESEK
ncbi:MAG: transcriptional repressor [Acidobacteriota bacterium]